jgi:hypothetical protein
MSKIALEGNASGTGTFTIAGPNTNTNYTITLPQETGTLVTTGVTTGLNGSAISTGVVAASVGGTGLTSAGTNGNVLTSNGSAWVSQAAAAGGGDYIMVAYTSPATWTKPAGLKAVKVTVIGAGGNGGTNNSGTNFAGSGGGGGGAILYLDAPAVPGPVSVTVGSAPSKTSSFGPLVSATGGTNGTNAPPSGNAPQGPYAGGTGSGGTINVTGGHGYGIAYEAGARGGEAALGFGTPGSFGGAPVIGGNAYGGGGMASNNGAAVGGNGGAGIVIVEEFY